MPTRALIAGLTAGCAFLAAARADSLALPPLDDLVRLLRTNLALNAADFDAQAGQAMVEHFGGQILGANDSGETLSDAPPLAKKTTLDYGCLYVRVGQISPALAPQFTAALQDTNWMNGARGLVLDLRFTSGTSFKAAAETAALFVTPDHKLLDWGSESFQPPPRTNTWKLPITVLVNHETTGAAEALGAVLRAENAALVIGGTTAGKASIYRDIDLGNGNKVRLPVSQAKTSDGQAIPRTGLVPDIAVKATLNQERAYLNDPFVTVLSATNSPSGTNSVTGTVTVRRRVNEAELVRARREDLIPGDPANKTDAPKTETRIVRDPALARALDVIKGMAVLNRQ